jgi:hypothetical protein
MQERGGCREEKSGISHVSVVNNKVSDHPFDIVEKVRARARVRRIPHTELLVLSSESAGYHVQVHM